MKGKKILSLLLTAAVTLGGCGMHKEIINETDKEIQQQFCDYMREKYDDPEYEIRGIVYKGLNQSYDLMNAYCTEVNMEGEFSVRRWSDEGQVRYEDTYQSLLLRGEIEERVEQKAQGILGKCKIYADTTLLWLNELGKPELTLEQALRNGEDIRSDIWILVPKEEFDSKEQFEDAATQLAEEWKKEEITAYFSFYYMKGGMWEGVNRENCYDIGSDNYIDRVYYSVKAE